MERVRARVDTAAKELQLSAAEREALLDLSLREQSRRDAALASLREEPARAEARVAARAELDAIRVWKAAELRRWFGSERAHLLLERH